jgi:type I restriction enzyme S subunit
MQQLLTGKQRLPDFNREWDNTQFGSIGNCFAGGTPSTFINTYWGGEYTWLQSGRVQNCVLRRSEREITITREGLENSAARLISPNSVLVAITGATCGNIGLLEFQAAANQSVVAIEPYDDYDYRFVYQLLLTQRNVILANRGGSAQGGINLTSLKSIHIKIPEKPEQIAIASILSDMDAEIDVLTVKLNKLKDIKHGMRQILLTGQIRLMKHGDINGATKEVSM